MFGRKSLKDFCFNPHTVYKITFSVEVAFIFSLLCFFLKCLFFLFNFFPLADRVLCASTLECGFELVSVGRRSG